jgi:signal transduction histidine kinase
MNAATRSRIFEPFFTTKDATGTGLGLWVSHEIIEKHSGTVRVRSRSREESAQNGKPSGTVFMMFFPEDGIASRRQGQEIAAAQTA